METSGIKAKILYKMLRHKWIGGRHTHEDNLRKGFDRVTYPLIEGAIDALKKEGFFRIHKKPDGIHLALEPRKVSEANALVSKWSNEEWLEPQY